MARLKHFVHSILSGYLLLGTNVAYTLASIPLALTYLSKAEFGLWAIASQLTAFLGLIDAGMGNAVGRMLVDEKDNRESTAYGTLVQTAAVVNVVQGLIVLGLAVVVSVAAAPVLQLPTERYSAFRSLVLGQGLVLSIQFGCRVFANLLVAHQRNDAGNYLNSLSLIFSFAILWLSFVLGAGVMALVWSQLAGAVLALFLAWLSCCKLGLLPAAGKWGHLSWGRFSEMFSFGQRILLLLVGQQLIHLGPTIIVSRLLGLEAAAVWSICTRPFLLLLLIITRIFDASAPAFAEMIVRGENDRLIARFRALSAGILSVSVAAACLLIVTNQPFVTVWTGGKIGWPVLNDVLLGLWLVTLSLLHVHAGLILQTKELGYLPGVVVGQGIAFVGITLVLLFKTNVPEIPTTVSVAILSALMLSLPYSLVRTSRYFRVPLRAVAFEWTAGATRFLILLSPLAAGLWWATESFGATAKLLFRGVGISVPVVTLLFRVGIDQTMRQDLLTRAPGYLRRPLRLLIGEP